MTIRDNETVRFEAATEQRLERAFADLGRIADSLNKLDDRLKNIESWHWKIMGGVTVISGLVSFIVVMVSR